MMDRNKGDELPKLQVGFIDFVCTFVYKVRIFLFCFSAAAVLMAQLVTLLQLKFLDSSRTLSHRVNHYHNHHNFSVFCYIEELLPQTKFKSKFIKK